MKGYFFSTPVWMIKAFPQFWWSVDTEEKILFLTFDDGPTPTVTPFVLDLLDDFQAKATFFCIGENAIAYPKLFNDILHRGHMVGNHTQSHLNAWETKNASYIRDIKLFDEIYTSKLFRPPYGKLKPFQQKMLTDREIIMWSHMAGDFDPKLDLSRSKKALLKAKRGSIMVFHDSIKAFENLRSLLPAVLGEYADRGYAFKTLNDYAVN